MFRLMKRRHTTRLGVHLMTTFLLNLLEGFNGDQRKYMELQLFLEINLRGGEWDPKFMDLQ